MRKKDLIKRIEILERQIKNADGPIITEAKIRQFVLDSTRELRDYVYDQGRVLSIYKDVLLKSGVISNCEANRTEYQWRDEGTDSLHRNFHFKINKVRVDGAKN